MTTDGNNNQNQDNDEEAKYRRLDAAFKAFFKNKERIAELINKTVFKGKYTIDPDNVVFLETELVIIDDHGVKQPRRDIIFGVKDPQRENKYEVIVNFEGQGAVDFAMAFRSGDYAMTDCKIQLNALREQQFQIRHNSWAKRKEKVEKDNRNKLAEDPNAEIEKFTEAEPKRSNYVTKDTKLPYYISIVLHYGPGKWTAGLSTKSNMEGPPGLDSMAPEWNYQVIDPADMDDDLLNSFSTDVKVALKTMKLQNKREELVQFTQGELPHPVKGCGFR